MIIKKFVLIDNVDKVKEFVSATNKFSHDTKVIRSTHEVDAKSIMGLFTLDLSSPVTIEFHEDDKEMADNLIGKFYVKG